MRIAALFPLLTVVSASAILAQTPAPARYVSVIGTVASVDGVGHVFSIKTDKAGDTTVKFDEKTSFLRIPAGETDIKKATPAKSGDVGPGDRILARVHTEDPTGVPALTFYITKQAEIAQRAQKSLAEWQTQSVAGLVKAVDAGGKQVTITVRGAAGAPKDVVIDLSAAGDVERFNPDSQKYEPGTAASIQSGDQLRVLGEKNADVTQIKADAIMFGSFRSIPVMIKSIDPATSTIAATDLGSKKPITIALKPGTSLKKLDDNTAMMLARRLNPSFQGGRGAGGGGRSGGDAAAAAPPAGGGGRGGGRGGAGMDLNRILDQQPAIQLADLKAGDPLIVTGSASADMSKLTATAIVAGVDPILRAAPQNGPDPLGGNWNLGDGGPPAQ
jgi:hypothetical protein